MGKFAAGTEDHQKLVEAATEAFGEACMTQMSVESVFDWPHTLEELDRSYPDKEHIMVDGEEAVERLMGLLREGTWLVEDNEMTDGDLSGERLETPTPNRGGGTGATGGESIESLSQKLGTKNEEEEDGDVDMTDGPGVGGSPSGAGGKDKGKGREEEGQEGKEG